MEQTKYVRHPAVKVSCLMIEQGTFMPGNDQTGSSLLLFGQEVYRINLVGVIIQQEHVGSMTNILLDDGSGSVLVRFFEENSRFPASQIGSALLVIGKVRMYAGQKYISPEASKFIHSIWLQIRVKELAVQNDTLHEEITREQKTPPYFPTPSILATPDSPSRDSPLVTIDTLEVKDEEEKNNGLENVHEESAELPFEKLLRIIKELDTGEGALMETIIGRSSFEDTEYFLGKMLERGDIFQNLPGRVKVL